MFREFLSQLLKAAFDPNRGFFTLTRDQMLYPRYYTEFLVNPFLKILTYSKRRINTTILVNNSFGQEFPTF